MQQNSKPSTLEQTKRSKKRHDILTTSNLFGFFLNEIE